MSVAIALSACAPEGTSHHDCPPTSLTLPEPAAGNTVDEDRIAAWVELLADPAQRGRRASTPEAHAVAGLLGGALDRTGLEAVAGGRCQAYAFQGGEDFNVIGHLESTMDAPWVLVSAHYDGRGVHPSAGVLAGADDNASGVAALLEVMRLASLGPPLPVSVIFVLFGAEEIGFVGVRTWLTETSLPTDEIELMINLDMVGRLLPDGSQGIGYSFPESRHREWIPVLEEAALRSGVPLVSLDRWHTPKKLVSDSTVVAEHFPAVLLSTGLHADYHQAGDTADKIDPAQIGRAVELTLEILGSSLRLGSS